MLRMLGLVLLGSSSIAIAQAAPQTPPEMPVPTEPAPAQATEAAPPAEVPPADVAPPPAEVAEPAAPVDLARPVEAPEEQPLMKKVCHTEDVVGSAFPRKVCKMKPVKPPKGS